MSLQRNRSFSLIVNGQEYCVEIGDLTASPAEVCVNGNPYQVSIESIESQPVTVQPVATATSVVTPNTAPPPKPAAPVMAGGNDVRAPMPGDILNIAVKPGDKVVIGQQLCMLEAMKMKSAIRSARDAVIASVEVAEGQAVSHGDVLITFE
jgi:biotin carboxyl carrier protein